MKQLQMTVGVTGSDIAGFTNQHIQAAVDRVAYLGGGEVVLSAGTFDCADSVHLRSHVHLRGQGKNTVLRKNAMKQSPLSGYIAFGHEDLIVADPDVFDIADGFIVTDDNSGGFGDTQGTIIGKENGVLIANTRHARDYWHRHNGHVQTLYALVSVIEENKASVSSLVLDGNAAENSQLNGCRGGAFFGHFADDIHVNNVHVRNFNGEGFSFQTCHRMHIEQSTAIGCTGNGFHPGSASMDFHIHDCHASENHHAGLFYCVRVRNGVLENCEFVRNKRFGVSIGERDIDSINRNLICSDNEDAGIYFRGGDAAVSSHNTVIDSCTVENNGSKEGRAQIHVQGVVEHVHIRNNTISGACGIYIAADVVSCSQENNTFSCENDVEQIQ
ncbi:MAG: right-handed parallel beta-helix repeat-containing protein [Planctomycetes bacterium]|nr:right-handed parallel beta-helix repeat-containing protein [Planctomycetota bacterium]